MGGIGYPHPPEHAHAHAAPYKIPDYKIYKVEDVPELMAVKRALAQKGLKDPWLRNEVWKYTALQSRPTIWRETLGRGMKWGFVAAVITTAIGYVIQDDPHGHGGDGGHH